MKTITRKTMLYQTDVEYGNYCLNHVLGCSHGCLYPCYAMMMAKRFGKIRDYEDWIKPKIVGNTFELLKKRTSEIQNKLTDRLGNCGQFNTTTPDMPFSHPHWQADFLRCLQE